MRLASFDIFDTTLLRRCGTPDTIFQLMAQRLFPEELDLRQGFIRWRRGAESSLPSDKRAVATLQDIYSSLDAFFLKIHPLEYYLQVEKDVERENLLANPSVRSMIDRCRQQGYQIAFISDMYLDSDFLRQVLSREECMTEEDALYVSCEYGARKDEGALYEVVRDALKPFEWIHTGDNDWSDIRMAKRKGIHAVKVETGLNAIEKNVERRLPDTLKTLPWISRLGRIMYGNDAFSTMAADFLAPAYLPYVLFILRDAQRRGIRRLYFLSRDGYILMKAAESLSAHFPQIELRYLFVSRKSLTLPYIAGCSEKEFWTLQHGQRSVDKILRSLGTDREELAKKYSIHFEYQLLNPNLEKDFYDKLFRSAYTPDLLGRAKQKEDVFVRYLQQEGLLDGVASAAVDVGWLGTTRMMLNGILRRLQANEIESYYWGVRRDVFCFSEGRYTTYSDYRVTPELTGLLEAYFSLSPYPTTVTYEMDDRHQVQPVFPENKRFTDDVRVNGHEVILKWMAESLMAGNCSQCEHIHLWSEYALDVILKHQERIDFTPLINSGEVDGLDFVRRLNRAELFRTLSYGKQYTCFNRVSLCVTLPSSVQRFAWKWDLLLSKLRGCVGPVVVRIRNRYGSES
jgi:predicted HAD superfamily hydrolase